MAASDDLDGKENQPSPASLPQELRTPPWPQYDERFPTEDFHEARFECFDDVRERQHLLKTVYAFLSYYDHARVAVEAVHENAKAMLQSGVFRDLVSRTRGGQGDEEVEAGDGGRFGCREEDARKSEPPSQRAEKEVEVGEEKGNRAAKDEGDNAAAVAGLRPPSHGSKRRCVGGDEFTTIISTPERLLVPPQEEDCGKIAFALQSDRERALDLLRRNQRVIDAMLSYPLFDGSYVPEWLFEYRTPQQFAEGVEMQETHARVESLLRHLVRDWTDEGRLERDACYGPLMQALLKYLPLTAEMVAGTEAAWSVMVPGSGTNRLLFEVIAAGYSGRGNEFSNEMLLFSNFLLNCCEAKNEYTVYPWVTQFKGVIHNERRFRPVQFPDVCPSTELRSPATWRKLQSGAQQFGMAGGEFVEMYADPCHKSNWDGCLTCFFIDTARNFLQYLRVIAYGLRKGGVWANIGPLHWHFADQERCCSVELSHEEVLLVVAKYFEVVVDERRENLKYDDCSEVAVKSGTFVGRFWVGIRNDVEVTEEDLRASNEVYTEEQGSF